ncbi:xanthine dehydrogenase family protein molybdopterin-binding subunit [Parapedomonas caeni]
MMKFGGQSVRRVEDERLVTGHGRFTDDISVPGMVFGVTVRSPYGHARIGGIDTTGALAIPGVLAVYTAADMAGYGEVPCLTVMDAERPTPRPLLAVDTVRHVGDPVAFVVADSREAARQGAEAVEVDYDDLPAVESMPAALAIGAPELFPHIPGNVAFLWEAGDAAATDAAIAAAHHVTRLRVAQPRVAPTSMEVRAALGQFEDGRFTLTTGTQGVVGMRDLIAGRVLGLPSESLRVVTHDVGGGFGMKNFFYPEYALVLHAARALGRPVKWTGERADAFQSDTHGRDLVSDVTLALDADGRFLALKVETDVNLGAYQSQFGPYIQTLAGGRMIGGVYAIPAAHNRVRGVLTNTTPTDAYRGAGRPEACYITERVVDAAAHEMGIAPDVLRRRNLLRPEQLPHRNPLGQTFDLGDFPAVLDSALARADWQGFAARKADASRRGRRAGRGLCYYVEIAGGGGTDEYADARLLADGTIEVAIGTQSNGQGHETAYAQVVADRLGVAMDRVRIVQGDTDRLERGHGTGGSRSLQFGGAAGIEAADALVAAARPLAEAALEADAVDYADGVFIARATNRTLDWQELAQRTPDPLSARGHYKVPRPTPTFPNGCHVAEVEIDPETGVVAISRYTVVDDFGTIINPMLVEGQVHGGIAQGLGQVLLELVVYGEGAQLITGSLTDYGIPRADMMPAIDFSTHPVPNPNNPLGVKGCGEAGTIGVLAAVMNAIIDALDGQPIDMPATPEVVWRALRSLAPASAA